MVHIYNGILVTKKNETLPFTATWMELAGIMLNEISQKKTNTIWYHLYVECKKHNKLVNITKKKKKQTQRYREEISGYHWGEGRRERKYRGMGIRGTNY